MRAALRSTALGLMVLLAASSTGCYFKSISGERMRALPAPTPATEQTLDGVPLRERSVAVVVDPLGIYGDVFTWQLRFAIRETVEASGIFGGTARPEDADLRLDVTLGDVLLPWSEYGRTTELRILWTLSDARGARICWQSLVTSRFTADPSLPLLLYEGPARVAFEGAFRENIRLAVQRLAAATLEDDASGASAYHAPDLSTEGLPDVPSDEPEIP